MAAKTTQWILEFVDKITAPMRAAQNATDDVTRSANKLGEELDEVSKSGNNLTNFAAEFGAKSFVFKEAAEGISRFNGYFKNAISPGVEFQSRMAELSAITQKTGGDLDAIGDKAKALAADFGGNSSQQVEAFIDVIGSLGDQFADSPEALDIIGRNVGTLSKLMGGDAKAAANALSTAMLQYGVDLSDPIEASRRATEMMNTMQAAANVGGSEVSDTAEALRQSGLLAHQSGLNFEELNASLEGLAKGKIVAGEAGTAMRNILLSMSTLANYPKQVMKQLKAYGVDVAKVADPTVKFTDRLRELTKIQNDPGLMESVFMKANIAAGQTILNNIDVIDDWEKQITGTNAAVEGAAIVMDTYAEKQGRVAAQIENFKIGLFDAIEPIAPFIALTGDAVSGVAELGIAVWGLSILLKKDLYIGIFAGIKAIGSWILANGAAAIAAISTTAAFVGQNIATLALTASTWLLNLALWANPITWIVASIAALVAVVALAWNKCEGFRAVITGLWEVIKGLGNIIKDFVIDRIKGLLNGIGAMGQAIAKLFKGDFSGAWESAKEGVKGIAGTDAMANALASGKNLGENFSKGFEQGKADFQLAQADKSNYESVVGAKTIVKGYARTEADKSAVTKKSTGEVKPIVNSRGGGSDGLSGNGRSGGKSITMNLTLNNYLSGIKNPDEFVEIVVQKINDRLNDSLAIAGT